MKDSILLLVSETGKIIGHKWFDIGDAMRGSIELIAEDDCNGGRIFLASNLIPNHILDITDQISWSTFWPSPTTVIKSQRIIIKDFKFTAMEKE